MSDLRVNNIAAEGGTSAPSLVYGAQVPTGMGITGAGGINVSGVCTATSFSGAATGLTGVSIPGIATAGTTQLTSLTVSGVSTLTGNVDAVNLDASGNLYAVTGVVTTFTAVNSLTVTNDALVSGALTVTGNMTVDGTQTIVNTSTLDVADKTVGIASTTAATNTTAAGAGIEIYASSATANNNKTILWQNTSNSFEFSESIKPKGVHETSINNGSTGIQTYIDGTSLVLEMDVEAATVFNYTSPSVAAAAQAGGIGIVSFKNVPANAQNVTTVNLIHTQGKGTAGYGNTLAVQGIGITCRVIPKSGGAAVAGIMTRGWCGGGIGAASTITLTADGGGAGNVTGNVDIISFLVHYTGGTNTDLNSYKVYVSNNGGFNQGGHGV